MRRSTRSWLSVGLILGAVTWAGAASAASVQVKSSISKTMISGQYFGLCMFLLDSQPPGLDCPSNWVSASCSGDFNPSNVGWRKFEVAQMAQMLDKQVLIRVDDALKHNGQCYASNVQMVDE